MTKLVCTRSAVHVGRSLRDEYGLDLITNSMASQNGWARSWFPDRQPVIGIEGEKELKDEEVWHICCGHPFDTVNLFELEQHLLISEANDPKDIQIIFPYFPFQMQDSTHEDKTSFRPGERNIVRDILDRLEDYEVYILHPHFGNKRWLVTDYRNVHVIDTQGILQGAMENHGIHVDEFIAADAGEALRSRNPSFEKTRIDSVNVKVTANAELIDLIRGKTIGLGDDLIKSGGTFIDCIHAAIPHAKKIIAYATHGLLDYGVQKVRAEVRGNLFLMDTIARRGANVPCAPLIYTDILRKPEPLWKIKT